MLDSESKKRLIKRTRAARTRKEDTPKTDRDITERKEAETALRESEGRFRTLFECAPDGIYLTDLNCTFVDGNQAAEQLVGYSKEELIGKTFLEIGLLSPDNKNRAMVRLKKIASGEPTGPEEFTLKRKDGREVVVEISTFAVIIKGKTLSLGVAHDITGRKKAEAKLQASEERHRNMIELSPDAIVVVNKLGFIESCNSATEKISGLRSDEPTGKHFSKLEVFRAKDIPKYVKLFAQVLKGNIPEPFEVDFVRKDGRDATVEVRVCLLKDGNVQAIVTDITERKQAQERILDNREQLKSLASKLSLTEERERHRLATMLHDQVGQSLVFSRLQLDQLRKSVHSEEPLKALEEVCNSLEQVIRDTRTLTFDLGSPILYELGLEAAIAEWLEDQIDRKHGIKTEFHDDQREKPLEDDIRAVLFRDVRELLVNVVKHAQAEKVSVSVSRTEAEIHIIVEDNGKGFDPIEAAQGAAKRAEFGLFSIRERLEQLGGLLDVDSGPGRGCKILMKAPLKKG